MNWVALESAIWLTYIEMMFGWLLRELYLLTTSRNED